MIKSIALWFIKKYLLSIINEALKKLTQKRNMDSIIKKAMNLVMYFEKGIQILNSILKKIDDGVVTEEEYKQLKEEIQESFK